VEKGEIMKLESSLKHFSPQGMHISDDVKSTSPNRLTGTDVMAAIGTSSSRGGASVRLHLRKAISKTDEQLAVQALAQFTIKNAPKNVRKAAGDKLESACRRWRNLPLRNTHVRRPPAQRVTAAGTGFISRHEDV
jgi:hypothetical protein